MFCELSGVPDFRRESCIENPEERSGFETHRRGVNY